MDYERLVVDNLPILDSVVRIIGRRHRLSVDEQEELAASVRLKLVENNYEVLRKFEGRSQLRTYLITVVQRHFLDTRNARWGKWRPSAQAVRLGPMAVLLDQLLTRDRMSLEEALGVIAARFGGEVSCDQLHDIAMQLPSRSSRQFVDDTELEQVPGPGPSEQEMVEALDESKCGDRIERALAAALAGLSDEDRLILNLRFRENLKLARIAEIVGAPAKPFYRRVEELLAILRNALQAQGIGPSDIGGIVDSPTRTIGEVLTPAVVRKTADGPSVP